MVTLVPPRYSTNLLANNYVRSAFIIQKNTKNKNFFIKGVGKETKTKEGRIIGKKNTE